MTYLRTALIIFLALFYNLAFAQLGGEASEPTPEEQDAAYTAEDAARDAALWSDEIIDRSTSNALTLMTEGADLVFRGNVASQSIAYDGNDVPFTLTTFAVSDVLKGDLNGGEFTLIQEGGTSRTDENAFMSSSTSQYFGVGEEEVLFLRLRSDSENAAESNRPPIDDGDRSMRSLAQLVQYRLRIYGGQVYDEDGRGLIVEARVGGGQRLALSGDRHPAARFSEIPIGSHTLTKSFSEDSQDQSSPDSGPEGSAEKAARPSYTDSADIGTLITAIAAVSN